MNVRIFWVRAMKCMYAQTRPRFILSSEGVFGWMEFEPMLTPREKSPLPKMSPEEDRTRDAVDSEPKHYQLSYSGPVCLQYSFCLHTSMYLYLLSISLWCTTFHFLGNWCISETDLLRQLYMQPHWDRSCRSNLLFHPITVYWQWTIYSWH